MNFIFISIFPNLIEPYFKDSILKRAIDSGLIWVYFFDPREFTNDKHKKVDDYMIGGGAGLLMKCEPLQNCIEFVKSKFENVRFIYPTPAAKKFTQNDAKRLAINENLCFICGRYEGIDERIIELYVDEVLSLGDFILTGGELASLSMCDAISRNIKGVLGNANSLDIESFEDSKLEAPSFTKPNIFEEIGVNSEFLKGNHAKMTALKNTMALSKTRYFRPDIFAKLAKKG